MKSVAILALVGATAVWGFTGDATFYGATGQGTCSYEAMSSSPLLVTALNNPQWANSALCGTCARVTGPAGTAVVKIVDKCPECQYGDLDLSPDAFARIVGAQSIGRHTMSWTRVACPVSGNLQYKTKDGANNWWVALQVRNHPVGVTKLEIRESGSSTWINMDRTDYNFFVHSFGSGIRLPASVRVTACNGQQVVDNNAIRAINSGAVTVGSVQFSNLNPCA
eukprot:m51a1_g14792 hypothetical protein (223) ;mRNA; r:512381-513469